MSFAHGLVVEAVFRQSTGLEVFDNDVAAGCELHQRGLPFRCRDIDGD